MLLKHFIDIFPSKYLFILQLNGTIILVCYNMLNGQMSVALKSISGIKNLRSKQIFLQNEFKYLFNMRNYFSILTLK